MFSARPLPRPLDKHDSRQSHRPARSRAFTLIELLSVTAIIAVLSLITLVGVRAARKASYGATCMSNYRQLGVAILTYAGDHKGSLPGPMGSAQQAASYKQSEILAYQGGKRILVTYLRPYIELRIPANATDYYLAPIMLCPAWNAVTERYDPANQYKENSNSPYSSELLRVNQSGFGYDATNAYAQMFPNVKLSAISNPATQWGVRELYDGSGNKVPKPWHGGNRYTVVYIDGHVQSNIVPLEYQ